jgi:hypothetical protein
MIAWAFRCQLEMGRRAANLIIDYLIEIFQNTSKPQ